MRQYFARMNEEREIERLEIERNIDGDENDDDDETISNASWARARSPIDFIILDSDSDSGIEMW